jgi:CubicO group peptidase (beta-lactamase class C family)/D-alanyl-D-alanine dipeptidase
MRLEISSLLARAAIAAMLATTMATARSADTADRSGFDADIDAVVARYHLPGIAVGIIENGEVVHTRTVGERVAGSGLPITPDTLFKIASNSKAMTTSLLARLVDAGKLRWDDPVVKYLPQFRMNDPWVTQHMQVRDLLVHNSGLPEGGGDLMLWPEPNDFSRADIIAGLAHIKPAYGFRSGYAYDNLLYIVAGEVAAAAGGASYEELLRREVFQPLGLSRCQVGEFDRDRIGNVAQPHGRHGDRNIVVNGDEAVVPAIASAAAGGVRCSLDDMLLWARNWLAPDQKQLAWLSREQRKQMWTARTPMPISQRRRDWDNTHSLAYAFGFRLADVDGTWTVSHTGSLSGMYSAMVLLPDSKSGFVLMINGDGDTARTVLTEVLLKHFTAPGRARSVADYADELDRESKAPTHSRAPDVSARQPADIEQMRPWLGVWRDPWLGEVAVCESDGAIRFRSAKSPLLRGRVMRVGQRWLVDWDLDSVDAEAWLDFKTEGGVAKLSMSKVDPDADFSSDYEDLGFERLRPCEPAAAVPEVSPAKTAAETDLVDIATLVPDIALEMRYAGSDNFIGAPIDGYLAPKCLLLRPAAQALQRVEASLRLQGMRLKLFDCYRPMRAVRHFVRWAKDLGDQRNKARYYPNLDKRALLGDYIAPVSGHSRGATLDLTLLRCADSRCQPLDMGTEFDFFDPRANTESPGLSAVQRANRERLRTAMEQQGFRNYIYEWWHYTLTPEPAPLRLYDVPVQ